MLDTATDTSVPVTANPMVHQIETEFPIFLLTPKRIQPGPKEQFGVWLPGAIHLGDVIADKLNFTLDELRAKIRALLPAQ